MELTEWELKRISKLNQLHTMQCILDELDLTATDAFPSAIGLEHFTTLYRQHRLDKAPTTHLPTLSIHTPQFLIGQNQKLT